VRRERFLRPGPWTVLAESTLLTSAGIQTRLTPDANPARVYHNIVVAIDPSRQLFNGQPGTLGLWSMRSTSRRADACCTSAAGSATTRL
jgi:protein-L-isoaspartate(D-aspartate) O-methyltransferase